MKKVLLIMFITTLMLTSELIAKGKQRIGVYDSRVIAICWFQSEEGQKNMKSLMDEFKTAKSKGDTVQAKKLEEKGQLTQRILHDKGFGRGSVAEIIENKLNELKELAKKEKLMAICSKWELNFSSPDVEVVDITMNVLDMFNATDKVKKMVEEMKGIEPIKDAFFLEDQYRNEGCPVKIRTAFVLILHQSFISR
ncbi:MAG: hypothetical protein HZB41_10730 [Ignavibacteriae bacterium]|nr:hypothetical protein [Ignavibacteriota bacterium]